VAALRATPDGNGYWMASSNGGVYAFGDAPFFGSATDLALSRPIVGLAATDGPTVNPQDYTLAGNTVASLEPGSSATIDLRVTNPNPEPITLISTTTTVTTPNVACGVSNFTVSQGLTRPVIVPARTSATLAQLGVAPAAWPTVAMVETGRDQDACQSVQLTLHYQGEAIG
jgi:hypothetical protein